MTSLRRSIGVAEEMDRPDCDPTLLRRTYAQFPLVNRVVAGWRGNYVRFIRPVLRRRPETRILDVGCGGGDLAMNLARWALADGLSTQILGIDPDPRAIGYARQAMRRAALPEGVVQFRETTSALLAAAGEQFDVVLSNHLLHHLEARELQQLQVDTESLCTGIGLHSDIRRARAALLLFGTATLPLAGTSLIRRDGLVSIRRSYTSAELRHRARPGWEVQAQRTYRNALLWKAAGSG
ncbi:methyltransferase [Arthrobacter sp. MYb229]|uniref:methyltransferase domain-containing protein n=1 Tax=unclassified Arthrobacter TaxID=235627 RepID=UPI000CFB8204|nr:MULTISPECIES: methyltransferase domain-containing protein [unclassified Arthrobacter]PRA04529.1 methyltransferase [Arthrobacter sp. MYb229]PRB51558.1 methyltransferase [Arthrobacter sp. MYb216]